MDYKTRFATYAKFYEKTWTSVETVKRNEISATPQELCDEHEKKQ